MKKLILLVLSLAMLLSLCACGGGSNEPQTAEFGSAVSNGDFEIVVDSDILTATELNGDKDQHNEFLTTDLTNFGDTVLCTTTIVSKDGYISAVVHYTVKNIGKEKQTFKDFISLNYNDGFTYDSSEQYWTSNDPIDSWHQFTNGSLTSVDISPLSSMQCKAYFCIPEEVFTNKEAPLKLTIGNFEYTIR